MTEPGRHYLDTLIIRGGPGDILSLAFKARNTAT